MPFIHLFLASVNCSDVRIDMRIKTFIDPSRHASLTKPYSVPRKLVPIYCMVLVVLLFISCLHVYTVIFNRANPRPGSRFRSYNLTVSRVLFKTNFLEN